VFYTVREGRLGFGIEQQNANVGLVLLHTRGCDMKMSDGWRLMMDGRKGTTKAIANDRQITPNNKCRIRVLELAHAQVRAEVVKAPRLEMRGLLPEEADTQTDAATPGRGVQAG